MRYDLDMNIKYGVNRVRLATASTALMVVTTFVIAGAPSVSAAPSLPAVGSSFSWGPGEATRTQAQTFVLTSPSGVYSAKFQTDGNFVVYHNGAGHGPIFATSTAGSGRILHFRNGTGEHGLIDIETSTSCCVTFKWQNHVNTAGQDTYHVTMQDDGNFVEYDGGTVLWAANTVGK